MTQDNESQSSTEQPIRKGLHKYFHVYRLDAYISIIVAIVFAVFGFIELLNFGELSFIKLSNSFQFAMLFGIFGMISRMYYKSFEERYDKKK
jgi:hypothetical protein